ncbi:MAG: general secretion pathway protein M [Candidatus Endobugula sp.]|jgi:general secretion pathway protein M
MAELDSKIENIKESWQSRPASEKNILTVVGVMMMFTLFYFFIIEPIEMWREKQERLLSSTARESAQVLQLVERIKSQTSVGVKASEGLAKVMDESLRKNGLTMSGFQPGKNNDARLRLSDVTYGPLMQWLYEMEYEKGITIDELSISPTQKRGRLLVNVRVRKAN